MSNVMEEIKLSIAKNMPGMVGDELKRLLAEGDDAKEKLAASERSLAVAYDKARELTIRLDKHSTLDVRDAELTTRAQKLQEQELALLKREAAIAANIANAELAGVKDTLNSFLRNQTVRTNVQESVHVPLEGSPGGNGQYGSSGFTCKVDNNRTTTEEQQ